MPLRSRGYLLVLVAALAIPPQETAAVDQQTTVAAYDRLYRDGRADILKPDWHRRLPGASVARGAGTISSWRHPGRTGKRQRDHRDAGGVDPSLACHWFVPDVTLEQVLRMARDYANYTSIYVRLVAADLVASEDATVSVLFFAPEGVWVRDRRG